MRMLKFAPMILFSASIYCFLTEPVHIGLAVLTAAIFATYLHFNGLIGYLGSGLIKYIFEPAQHIEQLSKKGKLKLPEGMPDDMKDALTKLVESGHNVEVQDMTKGKNDDTNKVVPFPNKDKDPTKH